VDPLGVIDLSRAPFLDYLIPNNSGSPGIAAAKASGSFITASTVADLGGGANSGDDWQVVFDWTDGDPTETGDDFYGVSWGNWSGTETVTLETQIDLVQDGELTIYHWWNDGWDYSGEATLPGHFLTVSHYDASDNLIDEFAAAYLGGDFPQFYATSVTISRQAEGDYVIITNEGHNIGYKGTAVAGPRLAENLMVETQTFENGNIPFGYQRFETEEEIDSSQIINLSGENFADYLIPKRSGTPGIRAKKIDGPFISESTIESFTGGANSVDSWQVVFEWSDAEPTLEFSGFYGVSWSGWSNTEEETLETRINLDSTGPVTVYHWWNDGWNYNDPSILLGHILNVTQYSASGEVVDVFEESFPGGNFPTFYATVVEATRQNPGDYLSITNTGHNIGYKGTAVSGEPDVALTFDDLVGASAGSGDQLVSPWFGAYTPSTDGWILHSEQGWLYTGFVTDMASMVFWSDYLGSFLWSSESVWPVVYDYSGERWIYFILIPDVGAYLYDYSTSTWSPVP
jgi:hypothetical protein